MPLKTQVQNWHLVTATSTSLAKASLKPMGKFMLPFEGILSSRVPSCGSCFSGWHGKLRVVRPHREPWCSNRLGQMLAHSWHSMAFTVFYWLQSHIAKGVDKELRPKISSTKGIY